MAKNKASINTSSKKIEELEATNKELASLNEELKVVNNQLQDKVQELDRAKDDMAKLLNSSDLAMLFLDTELCIHEFSIAMGKLLGLNTTDVGRPIETIISKFTGEDLVADARRVLEKQMSTETEIWTEPAIKCNSEHEQFPVWLAGSSGRCYLRRISAYRSLTTKSRALS